MPRSLRFLIELLLLACLGNPSRGDSKGCLGYHAPAITVSANPTLITAVGRVLKAAPLAYLMHDHRARESHGLTGQHRSHMVLEQVHDTSMARFGGGM